MPLVSNQNNPTPSPLPEGRGLAVPVTPARKLPLAGLTILTAEDSRFASEAMRLLCQRSGAKLRRAETIEAARQHLRVYRPDILIIDLGLPDGDGTELIADLSGSGSFSGLLLAASADPSGRDRALAAGAAGYLEKPLESLDGFQKALLHWLKDVAGGTSAPGAKLLHPDRQALRDDLAHAADLLEKAREADRLYIARFIRGLARSSHDASLEKAAILAMDDKKACAPLARLLADRLRHSAPVFAGAQVGRNRPALSPK